MSDFNFTATAECEYCGAYLSKSDDQCDHGGLTVEKRVFRRVGEGRDSITGVESTADYKWERLHEKVGEGWIAYEYVGTKDWINRMLSRGVWSKIEDFPRVCMSLSAPEDISNSDE